MAKELMKETTKLETDTASNFFKTRDSGLFMTNLLQQAQQKYRGSDHKAHKDSEKASYIKNLEKLILEKQSFERQLRQESHERKRVEGDLKLSRKRFELEVRNLKSKFESELKEKMTEKEQAILEAVDKEVASLKEQYHDTKLLVIRNNAFIMKLARVIQVQERDIITLTMKLKFYDNQEKMRQ